MCLTRTNIHGIDRYKLNFHITNVAALLLTIYDFVSCKILHKLREQFTYFIQMYSKDIFDIPDLFNIHPKFWPLNTHLEDVTSQVICFMSIYKTIMCERERERGPLA